MRLVIIQILVTVLVCVVRNGLSAQVLNVTEKVLPNGLKVLLKEEHKSPVVTFQVWYKVGSRNEKLGTTGMSHLLEHMMFKGTKKYGPKTVLPDGACGTAAMTTPLRARTIPPISRTSPQTASTSPSTSNPTGCRTCCSIPRLFSPSGTW